VRNKELKLEDPEHDEVSIQTTYREERKKQKRFFFPSRSNFNAHKITSSSVISCRASQGTSRRYIALARVHIVTLVL
jgi:hypothetical protein